MRFLLLLAVLPSSACLAEAPKADSAADTPLDSGADSAADSGTETGDTGERAETGDTSTCAGDGEPCVNYEESQNRGWNNCCFSRQTCFPEGCYYSQP